jgi:hypothetical protein
MTIYQLLNEKNVITTIVKLINNKIISDTSILKQIEIYDRFFELDGNKTERYEKLSNEYEKHPDTIRKIITKLNKKAK